eukprot:gnl/MRDRNA2_/MRDRNA2_15444_c0_seq1.p1 gnl/MRDRNA2_/MRDRNA2_15444_c0~~gnl/MRDRNA2_/MRDRNA2_15444_c0_seq1.p1  ORF type:complete len:508 (-),score=76.64 gnl/MRDRNA2_/MRDRNA2_15444_c0_seq1:269-1792(-)
MLVAETKHRLVQAAGLIGIVGSVWKLSRLIVRQWVRLSQEPPLHRAWLPFLGSAVEFGDHSGHFLQKLAQQYGEIFTVFLAGQRMHFVADYKSRGLILKKKNILDFRAIATEICMKTGLHSYCNQNDGELHRIFTKYLVSEPEMSNVTERFHKELKMAISEKCSASPGGVCGDLFIFVKDLVFRASVAAFFRPTEQSKCSQILEHFDKYDKFFPVVAGGAPPRMLPGFVESAEALTDFVQEGVGVNFQDGKFKPMNQSFEGLIKARWEYMPTCPAWNESLESAGQAKRLRDTARANNTMLWAAVANTLPAAFWSLAYLLNGSESGQAGLRAVQAEISSIQKSLGRPLLGSDMKELPILSSAVKEALRLSTASLTIRRVQENCSIELASGNKWAVRKSDQVVLAPFLQHMDPKLFGDDVESYRHDRFINNDLEKHLSPFGGGVSMCPGRHIALVEMKMVVVELLLAFNFQPLQNLPPMDQSRAGLGILPPTGSIPFQASPCGVGDSCA